MEITLQQYVVVVVVLVTLLIILACTALRVRRLWAQRVFYVKDFEKLSSEARLLCEETAHVKSAIEEGDFLDASIKTACLGIVNAADEYDTGIRIALEAWEHMLHHRLRDSDAEVGKGSKEHEPEARRRHQRDEIGIMRMRSLEGIQRRNRLGSQMQWILTGVVTKDVDRLPATTSRTLPSNPNDLELHKNISPVNRFSAFCIPEFEFGHDKLDSRESQRPVSAQSDST